MATLARRLIPWSLVAVAACGPNYRYVYDGESSFERCYALDYESSATPDARTQCWNTWLQTYSYGASADRIDYARQRLTAQGSAPTNQVAPPSALPAATGQAVQPQTAMSAPPPRATSDTPSATMTLPTTPPPATNPWPGRISNGGNPVSAPPPTTPDSASTLGEPPGAHCGGDCRATWNTCGAACTGNDASCVARCDESYRDCMRGCF